MGVSGSVYATGLAAATATIANGSKVNGNVEAYSHFTNSASEATTLYNSAGEATENSASYATTLAGGDANVAVGTKSEIGGRVYADGATTATVSKDDMSDMYVIADTRHSVVLLHLMTTILNNIHIPPQKPT